MMDMCCGDEVKGEGYILNLILLVGGIKNRLKISVFYGEKVVHLADI